MSIWKDSFIELQRYKRSFNIKIIYVGVDKEVLVVAVQPSRPSVGSIVVLGLLVVFVVVSHFVVVVVAWPFVAVDNIAEGQGTVSSSSVLDWYLVECLIVV